MLKLTIHQLYQVIIDVQKLNGIYPQEIEDKLSPYNLYIFRNDELVLYIGRSEHVLSRVCNHLKNILHQPGEFLWENCDFTRSAYVEFLTVEECEPFIVKQLPDMAVRNARIAEQSLIEFYRPCFNKQLNQNATLLPDKYKPDLKVLAERMERMERPNL